MDIWHDFQNKIFAWACGKYHLSLILTDGPSHKFVTSIEGDIILGLHSGDNVPDSALSLMSHE
jgi:hypothetical protein